MAGMQAAFAGLIIDTSTLERITRELKPKAAAVVQTYGTQIAGEAAKNAPLDTGALRNSILSNSKMIADLTYRAQDAVDYGLWQELGTSRMASHPFLVPAMEAWRQKFFNAFSELFK